MTLTSGKRVIGWESCQYNDTTSYTQKVTWYFSDPELWYEAIGKASVPVLMSLVGSTLDRTTGSLRNFNHQYAFADYRPYLTQGVINSFQIPPGVYCKNDVNLKDLPTIPSHFTLRSEIIDAFRHTVGWTHEYYDSGLKLSRYDFKDSAGGKYGTNELKRIHDFNSGVAYIIDKVTGQCWTSTIKLQDYDNRDINGTHVRLRTPSEFFDLDRSNYSYVGQRLSRGITCDVWVSKSHYWPPPGPNYYATIWEYYFTADTRTAVGSTSEFNVPVQLRITQTVVRGNTYYIRIILNSENHAL
ncbi:EF-hand domain-containing protein D1 [Elysia marginata]|uniref:EF-hand domain-containing protein D1 n=1 Tax=Elysia marginata TaxID=1093978 RepID=A0AAV4II17_9GAST|nr:EF-hand domain-containing protein D1 [Elysia marginata]